MALQSYCEQNLNQFLIDIQDTLWEEVQKLSPNLKLPIWQIVFSRQGQMETQKEHKQEIIKDIKSIPDLEIVKLLSKNVDENSWIIIMQKAISSNISKEAFKHLIDSYKNDDFSYKVLGNNVEIINSFKSRMSCSKAKMLFKEAIERLSIEGASDGRNGLSFNHILSFFHSLIRHEDSIFRSGTTRELNTDILMLIIRSEKLMTILLANKNITCDVWHICFNINQANLRYDVIKTLLQNQVVKVRNEESSLNVPLVFLDFLHRTKTIQNTCDYAIDFFMMLHIAETNINCVDEEGNTLLIKCTNIINEDSVPGNNLFGLRYRHRCHRLYPLLEKITQETNINVNHKNEEGDSALTICARENLVEAGKLLLNHKEINVNCVDEQGITPIKYASCHFEYTKDIPKPPKSTADWVRFKGDVKALFQNEKSCLKFCPDSNQLLLHLLINDAIDVNFKDSEGMPLLHATFPTRHLFFSSTENFIHPEEDAILQHKNTVIFSSSNSQLEMNDEAKMYLNRCLINHPQTNINIVDDIGNTPLMISALSSEDGESMANILQRPETDLNTQNKEGNTALHLSVSRQQENLVTMLLQNTSTDVNIQDMEGKTALILASKDNMSIKILSELLKCPSLDVNQKDKQAHTALYYAVQSSSSTHKREFVKAIVTDNHIANLNYQDTETGYTPMHILLQENDSDAIIRLLQNKHKNTNSAVDFSLCDHDGSDVWDTLISEFKKEEKLQNVISLAVILPGLNINRQYEHKDTILHKMARKGCSVGWKILLEQDNLDVNLQDDDGNTALMYAVKEFSDDDIMLLMQKKQVNTQLRNRENKSLSDIVQGNGVKRSVKLMIQSISAQYQDLHSVQNTSKSIPLLKQVQYLKRKLQSEKCFGLERKEHLMGILNYFESDITINKDGNCGESYSMAEKHRKKLQKLHPFLCREIELYPLLNYLYSKDIITEEIKEEIECEKTRSKKCAHLLLTLPHRGPNAYQCFLDALRRDEQLQGYIADKIESFDPYDDKANEKEEQASESGYCGTFVFNLAGTHISGPLIKIKQPSDTNYRTSGEVLKDSCDEVDGLEPPEKKQCTGK